MLPGQVTTVDAGPAACLLHLRGTAGENGWDPARLRSHWDMWPRNRRTIPKARSSNSVQPSAEQEAGGTQGAESRWQSCPPVPREPTDTQNVRAPASCQQRKPRPRMVRKYLLENLPSHKGQFFQKLPTHDAGWAQTPGL